MTFKTKQERNIEDEQGAVKILKKSFLNGLNENSESCTLSKDIRSQFFIDFRKSKLLVNSVPPVSTRENKKHYIYCLLSIQIYVYRVDQSNRRLRLVVYEIYRPDMFP